MIMFVLNNPELLDKILNSWSELGITGATIIESTGLHRHRLERIPMRYTYGEPPTEQIGNTSVFVIVESEVLINRCLDAVEKIAGDLGDPDTGVFSAWPLTMTKGIPSKKSP